ncbi:phage holin family protein [Bacillus timonensis]|nr:phage holin family protein [Bacillus timonensis]
MKWLLSLIANSLVLLVVAHYIDTFYIEGFGAAILASIILSILNVIVKPILVVLTLPVTILSLGLFLFVINAITLMLTQALIGDAFVIDGFGTAVIAAVIISVLNLLIQKLIIDPIHDK